MVGIIRHIRINGTSAMVFECKGQAIPLDPMDRDLVAASLRWTHAYMRGKRIDRYSVRIG